ncbi:uncharacterized protein BKCO1_7000104 [Diplodia corticola]|uniref:Uncharacterized protein n=1 Tax=Diplodia corticola TaxID=236234 RepID=A0A1J9SCX5_9PEZI|nr:uncharacterized protein BKCO1_7000104 [Diplodia corticola]OJD37421.1 hypothetical protein BKCO1_7000104 [Diplodia corticola]
MSDSDKQYHGSTATSNDHVATLDRPATTAAPANSASIPASEFDIVEAAIAFLRKQPDSPANQTLTYDQVKAVFDEYKVYAEVCYALHKMGAVFTDKKFGQDTFCRRALADPKDRLPQYPDDE